MPRILYVTCGLEGHLNPCVGILQSLRGQQIDVGVLLLGADSITDTRRLALHGVDVRFIPQGAMPDAAKFSELLAAGVAAFEGSLGRLFKGALAGLPALRAAIADFAPDFVVVDAFVRTAAAIVAAHVGDIPYGLYWPNLMSVAPERVRTDPITCAMDRLLGEFLREHGVGWCEAAPSPRSRLLNIVASESLLVGDDAAVAGVDLVGFPDAPANRGDEESFDWSRLRRDRPFVYMSFGTLAYWQPALFKTVFAAAKRVGVDVVASVGDLAADQIGTPGEHVTAVRYAPQRELLAKAAAFVTHGGYNSMCESLAAGTPVLTVPVTPDTPITAHYVKRAGIGIAVDKGNATEDAFAAFLEALVAPNNSYATRAAEVSRACERGGAARAARRIADAARAVSPH